MNENYMKTLEEIQNSSSKIVLAGGVFDIIHPGHINTLNAAKKLGDVLVVVVATDKTAIKMKVIIVIRFVFLRNNIIYYSIVIFVLSLLLLVLFVGGLLFIFGTILLFGSCS